MTNFMAEKKMRFTLKITLVGAAVALAACASGPDQFRHAWVNPTTASDQATYNRDLDECRGIAQAAYDNRRESERGSAEAVIGAAATGAASNYGAGSKLGLTKASIGAINGAESQQGPLADQIGTLYAVMRECVRSRGYTPLQ